MSSVPSSTLSPLRPQIDWTQLENIVPVSTDTSIKAAPRSASAISAEQVSRVLQWANRNGAVLSPCGGATKQRWGNLGTPPDLVLSIAPMSQLIEHAWQDMTFTVQAGMTLGALQRELAKHGQRLALDPLWPERSTVGGVIATNDSGALRLRYGSVRDLILGATVVLANGTIARSGGKVVKNVAGYDLPKLLTGSMGTLAVIVEATFRAHPLPKASRTLSFRFGDFAAANHFILAIHDSTLVPASMQLRTGSNGDIVADIRFEGIPQGIDAQSDRAVALASGAPHQEISEEVWCNREELFVVADNWCVAKLSVLPSRVADACAAIARHRAQWKLVMQANGLGLARLETDSLQRLASSLLALRESVRQLGGTVVLLDGADNLRSATDVYGTPGDGHPLMMRVKQQFDPNGILNRGRFVGGI